MPNTVVKMPQLGESVSEGTIGRWLKQPGERVERDEPLVEIQTDKVNAEVPSPVAGILQKILLPEGTTAAVKTDMAIIGDETPSSDAPPPPPATFSYDTSAGGGVVSHAASHRRSHDPRPRRNPRRLVAHRNRRHAPGQLPRQAPARVARQRRLRAHLLAVFHQSRPRWTPRRPRAERLVQRQPDHL